MNLFPSQFSRRVKSFLVIYILLICSSANAQWKKIADFVGTDGTVTVHEAISCIYFLDLPGPPRIGFVGTKSDLWKTTDGGMHWKSVWDSNWSFSDRYVTDICFKDSLTGWFTVFSDPNGCYKTTDGGETWSPLKPTGVDGYGGNRVYYVASTNRLFLTPADYLPLQVSSNLGDTWETLGDWNDATLTFFTPLDGIVGELSLHDTATVYYFQTSDGGLTWPDTVERFNIYHDSLAFEHGGLFLPVPGTSTLFSNTTGRIVICRSDDYGRTWRVLKDFGPVADTFGNPISNPAPSGNGPIVGNMSRFYISTDSGFYVSTDSGTTWTADGGPVTGYGAYIAEKGITFAGAMANNGTDAGAGLWEEIWPQSGVSVAKLNASANVSVFPNPTPGPVTIRGASGPVVLTNVLGEIVLRAPLSSGVAEAAHLDLSRLPVGTYFVNIETAGGEMVRKILKK